MIIFSTLNKPLLAAILLFGIAGCSNSGTTSETSSDNEAPVEEVAGAVTDEVAEISVIIGQTSGSAIAYQASLGQKVRITILNPDADDEFHLHGYELGGGLVPLGQESVIEFTADKLGTFDLESHVTSEWILTLVVEE